MGGGAMKYTARDIADRLAQDVRGVAQMLLPQGKEKAGEWCAGSIGGDSGESLKVRLTGPKAGRWCDFADEDQRGDLLDLWAATQGKSLPDAFADACTFLGIEMPKLDHERKPATVQARTGSRKADQSSLVMEWLSARGFSDDTVANFRLAEHNEALMLPAFSPAGTLQYVKYRSISEKKFWSEAGGVPCLFGWQALSDRARHVVICEGELDCLAWAEFGIPALSPTNGAGNASWIETEYDNLARFDSIYLSYDMDDAGQAHVVDIAERLGQERCRIVHLPEKDANDCLLAGYTGDDMREVLRASETMDPQELVAASSLEDELIHFRNSGSYDVGVELPFAFDGSLFRIRPGELVILAGVNGSGKTELADQLTIHAASQGMRTCIGSFEFKPVKIMYRIQRQAGACADISDEYSRAISQWTDDRLWLFVPNGPANTERLLEVFEYAVRRYNIRWFVVDNLTKCGIGEEDYNGQKKFAERLSEFARDHDASVILCAHQRKGQDESRPSGKMDVKGSGGITDMADSVMVLWKNKKKAAEREKAAAMEKAGQVSDFDEQSAPDGMLLIEKQRNGESEPRFQVFYDFPTHQYIARYGYRPIRYVPWSTQQQVAA